MNDAPADRPVRTRTTAHLIAGLVSVVEALVLLAVVVRYVVEVATGRADSVAVALGSAALLLVFAVALVLGARLWWRGSGSPRMATFVWNLLLLPVAWTLLRTGEPVVGGVVGAVALAGAGAAVAAGDDDRASDGDEASD